MTATINNQSLAVKEYQNQRVVTFSDIDKIHERPDGTAKRNFTANKEHFIEGEDYFKIAKNQKDEFRTFDIPNRGIIVLTEFGYLLLVKSLTDKLAWKVQRELVKSYFRAKQSQQLTTTNPLLEQSVYHLQQSQQFTVNTLMEQAYELGELKNQYTIANKEIKALKSQASRTERKLKNHIDNKPVITYFGDLQALHDDMSENYQSFVNCHTIQDAENNIMVECKSIFRVVELDKGRLIFRVTKYKPTKMCVLNVVKAERIDNWDGNKYVSKYRLFTKDGESPIEFEAVLKR